MRHVTAIASALSSAVVACGSGEGATRWDLTEPGRMTLTSSSSGGSTGSTESESTSGSLSSTSMAVSGGPNLDMAVPDFGQEYPMGCKGKIDFLFVISAAGTMKPFQDRLIESFPGFIEAIEQQIPDFDVHILSGDPDGYWAIEDCAACTTSCDPQAAPPLCGASLDACDTQLGAGMTFPVGTGATNRRCELVGGQRYITSAEPDLVSAFTCVAQVGVVGAWARPAEAMVNALAPESNGPGGCNEGFLRDDALLVVTVISDVYDEDSAGTVESWITALRKAKHDDDEAFAVLVLTTDIDVGYWQLCVPEEYYQVKNPLRLLVEGVEHGFIGSICEKSYTPFFAETVAEIVSLCDGFVIPQ